MKLTPEIMYKAAVEKDVTFEGQFISAVKTTGIFCRPICTARKPKFNNVEFFKTTDEALNNGYRPCKVCKPLEKLDQTPQFINRLIKELEDNPSLKIKDSDLIARNLEPHTIRRWFLKNYQMTFHAYQRMLRISVAVKNLQAGQSVLSVA
jgi:AraC family transcriptional regulator, regulatory protein of adaptative response / methylated-DNA-[protein]-cysteine methyltransferase